MIRNSLGKNGYCADHPFNALCWCMRRPTRQVKRSYTEYCQPPFQKNVLLAMISIGFSFPALVCMAWYIHKTFQSLTTTKKNHQTSIINTIVLLFLPESLAHYLTLISLRRPSIALLEAEWTLWRSALYGDDHLRFTYSVISLLRTSKGQTELGVLVLDLGTVWGSIYLGPQKGSVILTCL